MKSNVKTNQIIQNIKGFVNDDVKLFENMKTKALMCGVCLNSPPRKFPYGIGMKLSGDFDQHISKYYKFSSQLTIVSSLIQQDKCIRRGLEITSLAQFPQIKNSNNLQVKQLSVELDSQQLLQTWQCSKKVFSDYTECSSQQIIYQSNKAFENLLILHRIDSPQLAFRNPSIQYYYIQYNDRYFTVNEILFFAWIGVEIIFIVIMLYLKETKKDLIEYQLVGCSRNYLLLLVAIILNNEVFLPIQTIKEKENLRIANMVCQTISLCIMFGFILQCFRNIRSFKVVGVLPLDILVILFFGICYVVFQINAVNTFHTTIINDIFSENLFELINLEYRFFETAIILLFLYFTFHVIHTLYLLSLIDEIEQMGSLLFSFNNLIERHYIKSCRIFIFYSSFFAYGVLIRLIVQYLLYFQIDLIYFDQILTGFINLFYFLLWNLFDQDEQLNDREGEVEEIELKSEPSLEIQNELKQDLHNDTFKIVLEDVKDDKNITFDQGENRLPITPF